MVSFWGDKGGQGSLTFLLTLIPQGQEGQQSDHLTQAHTGGEIPSRCTCPKCLLASPPSSRDSGSAPPKAGVALGSEVSHMPTDTGVGHRWLAEGTWGDMWRAKHEEDSGKCRTFSLKNKRQAPSSSALAHRVKVGSGAKLTQEKPARELQAGPCKSGLCPSCSGQLWGWRELPRLGWGIPDRPTFPRRFRRPAPHSLGGPLCWTPGIGQGPFAWSQESCSLEISVAS